MTLGFFWAFALLATALAAPIDGSRNLVHFPTSLTDSLLDDYQLDNSLRPGLQSFTSSSDDTSPAYLKGPSPVIQIGYVNSPNIQPSPEPIQALNVPGSGEPNLNTGLPMSVPVGFNLDAKTDFFNTAQANGDTLECNPNQTMCSYCKVPSGCVLYTLKCEKSDPDNCSLCNQPPGMSAAVCMTLTDELKQLPPPQDTVFGVCSTGQCKPT